MKPSLKPALYSALIFPGVGHYMFKHYVTAAIFATVSLGCLGVILLEAHAIAQSIADRILLGEIPFDIPQILQEVRLRSGDWYNDSTRAATWILVACWVGSSLDAYRVARRLDRAGPADDLTNGDQHGKG